MVRPFVIVSVDQLNQTSLWRPGKAIGECQKALPLDWI